MSEVCAIATSIDVFCSMDWTNDLVLQFLEIYQLHPCIWDPKNRNYKDKKRRQDAWKQIQNELNCSCTVEELKKKREILMASYRAYKQKIKRSKKSGIIYEPNWYAFEIMDSFLSSVYTCRESAESSYVICADESEVDQADESSQSEHVYEEPSTSQQRTTSKRREHGPSDLQKAEKQIEEALNIIKTVSQRHQQLDDDDECTLYGKLIAKKLRRLSDDRRDLLMIKINELLYEESQHRNRPVSRSAFEVVTLVNDGDDDE